MKKTQLFVRKWCFWMSLAAFRIRFRYTLNINHNLMEYTSKNRFDNWLNVLWFFWLVTQIDLILRFHRQSELLFPFLTPFVIKQSFFCFHNVETISLFLDYHDTIFHRTWYVFRWPVSLTTIICHIRLNHVCPF